VSRVIVGLNSPGVRELRRTVERRGRLASERVMRTDAVVLLSKAIKFALLGPDARARRLRCFSFHRPVHALVLPVLLWARRLNALMLNAESNPPNIELTEAVQAARREGHAVVCADGREADHTREKRYQT